MKYFIGTDEEYAALNQHLGEALTLPLNSTERYAPDEPERDFEGNAVMPILPFVYAYVPEGTVLVESYQAEAVEVQDEEL